MKIFRITCNVNLLFLSYSFLIQYRRHLWKVAMENVDLRCEGFVFTDDEMLVFYDHFYSALQKKLASLKSAKTSADRHIRDDLNIQTQQLSIAMTLLGDPSSKRSTAQASFRRDLRIVCESAGVGNCCLVLSDDCRFLDAVVNAELVHKKFKTCVRKSLGVHFKAQVKPLSVVVKTLPCP